MSGRVTALLGLALLSLAGFGIAASASWAIGQKTTHACREEWNTDIWSHEASGIANQHDLMPCRAGAALGQPAVTEAAKLAFARARRPATEPAVHSTIKDLMDSIVDPSADVLWNAVGSVVDQEGIHDSIPSTPEQWLDLRRAAVRLVEAGNLLVMPGRAAAPPGHKSEVPGVELEPAEITALIKKKRKRFNGFARGLQVMGLEAMRATEAKDADMLIEIGGRMQDLCESCHQTFWYPQAKRAATRN